MTKRYMLFWMMLIIGLIVNAQKNEELVKRFNHLSQISDPNQKRFEILELSKRINAYWNANNDINLLSGQSNQFKYLQSEDGMMKILSFGDKTYSGVYQLEWLVNFKGRTFSFSEEFNYDLTKELSFNYSLNQSEFNTYRFKISNGKQTIVHAIDLETKCLFEQLQTLKADDDKDSLNQVLQVRLSKLWYSEELFKNSFQGLKRMKTLHSDDGKLKICTYNIQKEGFKHQFYGGVILREGNEIVVIPLNDSSDKIRSPERSSLTSKKWYGALYLDLIQTANGNRTYYTLIGYKGHNEFTKVRVLDVLTIQNGRLRFGMPIFKTDRLTKNRVIFEYSAKASMMLRYDEKYKTIVFDNLAPSDPMFRGVYNYYGPDFSYNEFKFTKGVWELKRDVDLRNPKP